METRKKNEFFDVNSSDEEDSDRGYDSEAVEESKIRATKRRKVLNGGDDDFTDSDDEGVQIDRKPEQDDETDRPEKADQENQHVGGKSRHTPLTSKSKTKQHPIKLLDKPLKKNKTGVIYLSSLPPYLKPSALKTLLLQRGFGPITKIFLTPAVPSTSGRKRNNRRKIYTDGWIEFASKKMAKICAEALNAGIIGGRKGGWYHDDVWNMKYLKGFKWDDLMEQVQRERSEREARRRIEDTRSRKEDKIFLAGVEKGKVVEGIRKKREEKKAKSTDTAAENDTSNVHIRRVFKQNEVRSKEDDQDVSRLGEDTKRVLGKIF